MLCRCSAAARARRCVDVLEAAARARPCSSEAERDARDAKRRPIYENGANPRDGPGLIPLDAGGQFPRYAAPGD